MEWRRNHVTGPPIAAQRASCGHRRTTAIGRQIGRLRGYRRRLATLRRSDLQKVIKAAVFAAHKHRDQRRKDQQASPYINHPLALANVLCNEVTGVEDPDVICAALLHDTIEDTDTSHAEIEVEFGRSVLDVVLEVTDDKTLPKAQRKILQIEHAPSLSRSAKLVKLADKICNLRDMAESPPSNWSLDRRIEYFDWAKAVVDGMRGTSEELENLFDQAFALRPHSV